MSPTKKERECEKNEISSGDFVHYFISLTRYISIKTERYGFPTLENINMIIDELNKKTLKISNALLGTSNISEIK